MTAVGTTTSAPPPVRREGTFSVIAPASGDAAALEGAVSGIADRLRREPGSEILLVVDGSTPGTWPVARHLASRDWGEVAVRALRSDEGRGEAYRCGAAQATGRYVVFAQAGLASALTDLDAFLRVPEDQRPAFAVGSASLPRSLAGRSLGRRVASFGSRLLTWGVLGFSAPDAGGSMIVDGRLVERLVPETQAGEALFRTELAALARSEGISPVEMPVEVVATPGPSTDPPRQDPWPMLRALLALRRRLDAGADERARRRLLGETAPGPVLARLVRGGETSATLTTLLGAISSVALCLGAIALVAAVLRWVVERGEPRALHMLGAAAAAVAVVALVVALVRWLLIRALGPPPPPSVVPQQAPPHEVPTGSRSLALVAAAAAAAAIVTVGVLWRVLPDLATTTVGSGDARYWYWLGWQLAEQVRGGDLFPGGIDTVVWPYGYSVRVADGFLPAVVVTVWNLLLSDPTLAFNVATATAVTTTAIAGLRLSRSLGAGPLTAGIGGVSLALAPALFTRPEGHYNLLFAFPAVLLVDVALRHVLRRTQPVPVLRTAVLLVLAYLSSGYYFLFGGIAMGVILLAGGLGWRRLLDTAFRLGAAAVMAVILLSPFLVPKLQFERREAELGAVPLSADAEAFASDATSVFTPPDGTWLNFGPVDRYNDRFGPNLLEATAFPGLLPLLGFGALLLFRSPVRRPLLAAGAVLWVLGLGTTFTVAGERLPAGLRWLPVTPLLDLPGFAGVRALNRSSFVLAPIAVAAAVVVLSWAVRRSGSVGRVVVLTAAGLAVAASVRVPVNSADEPSGSFEDALVQVRDLPGAGAVLHLPDDCVDSMFLVEYQILHQRPLVGCQGFTSAVPWRTELGPYAAALSWAALRCEPYRVGVLPSPAPPDLAPSPEAAASLRTELGVGVVIFDTTNACPDRSPAILDALTSAGRVLGGDGEMVVIALPPSDDDG